MKRLYNLIVGALVFCVGNVLGQEFDVTYSATETNTTTNLTYEARNSVTLGPNYSYTPNGGSMAISITNPVVTGMVTYNSSVDPETRTLNTTYLVGATNGSLNVNSMGGATYSIPLELLPGVNGLAPNLSLVYSSNSEPGIAGHGWQISGLSTISRGPKTYYGDGTASGVELDTTDRFYLDGQRLVNTSTFYHNYPNVQYQTDVDIFTRVTPKDMVTYSWGPTWFNAETKSGLVYEYGHTTASKQKVNGYIPVLCWYVSKVSDLFGNQINYNYIQDNNNVYPAEITYGPNTITFYYKERYDKYFSYHMGTKYEQWLLLDKITVKYNTSVVKTYELKYNYNYSNYNDYSVLNEIIEYGINNSRLNSTAITYQIPANVSFSQTLSNTSHLYLTYTSYLCTGDFNGDGKADFVCLPDASKGATWSGMRVFFSDGNDNFTNYFSETTSINLSQLKDIRAVDINADGNDDLIYEIGSTTSSFFYMLYDGSSFTTPTLIYSQPTGASTGLSGKVHRFTNKQEDDNEISGTDYNGDGANDIFLNDPSGNWRIMSFVNPFGQMTSTLYIKGSGTISTLTGEVLSGDFNGDGKADLWSIEDNGVKIYTLTGSTLSLMHSSTWPSKNHFFNLGDFNGDRKTDVFLYGNKSGGTEYDWSTWQIQRSTGSDFEQLSIPQKKANLKNDYVRLGDFNGDGNSDIMVTSSNQSWSGTYFYMAKYQGNDLYNYTLTSFPTDKNNFYLADYNGDGHTDFICTDAQSTWWSSYKVYKTTGNTAVLMEKIGNGLGFLNKITYTKLSQATSSVYQRGTGATFPVADCQGPITVVSSVQADNGKGTMNTQNYYYEGLKIHLQGKGFLAYSKSKLTDVASGIESESSTGYHTTYFYPQLIRTIAKRTGTTDTIEKVTYSWSHKVLNASKKQIFPYVQTSVQKNKLTGHTVTMTTSGYDNYGNPSTIVNTYSNGPTVTTNNSYNNIVSSTQWLLGRLALISVQYSQNGTTITRSGSRTLLNSNNNILSEEWHSGTMQGVKNEFEYYDNGTLKKQTIRDTYTDVSRSTQYAYEPNGIRLQTVTDPLSHTAISTYDTYGRLSTQQDYLINTVTYQYDNLNRPTTVTLSDGGQITTVIGWETPTSTPKPARYSIQKTGKDGSQTKSWFDKLGREIRSDTKGFDGTMIYTVTKYNYKGQVDSISNPYYSNGTPLWNRFIYDVYGRKINQYTPSGRNSTWQYNTNSVTETTAGKTYTKTFASDGTLSSATDAGGTITYTYFPDGRIKTINAPGNIQTKMQYDIAGNQTQLVDPSAGTINYIYNGFGEITNMQNARNQTTQLTYYSDGRPYQKTTSPEGTTTYAYNVNKQLSGITSPGNISCSYSYDSKGRITGFIETIPGSSPFSTTFTYDKKGRDSTITHPSGIVEKHNYNANGYLSSVDAGGSTRWSVTAMNALQQITGGRYGSNLNVTFGYNAYGYPTSTVTGTLQNYQYDFDNVTGNLNWRKNILQGNIQENFEYDNLERLDRVYRGATTLLDMAYHANKGGITTKSDIGTIVYRNARPYADSLINPSAGIIPGTAQAIAYTSFEKVSTITENGYNATFTYLADNERAKMVVLNGSNHVVTRWYPTSRFMKDSVSGNVKKYTYIGGDAYTAPVMAVTQNGTTNYYYLLRDYLGSITHVVNTSNSVVAEYSYDAWGRMRNPATWVTYAPGQEPELTFAGRGFTGHEHLPWFKLINMNGRVYDPLVGQFLSPDNFIQDPAYTQNYNRFSYCMNNPLRFTDPSGYIFKQQDFEPLEPPLMYSISGGYRPYSNWGDIDCPYTYKDGRYENSEGMTVSYYEVYNNYISPISGSLMPVYNVIKPMVMAYNGQKSEPLSDPKINALIDDIYNLRLVGFDFTVRNTNLGLGFFVTESGQTLGLFSNYFPTGGGGTPWMSAAIGQLGVTEIAGSKHNPSIIGYHATTGGFKDDETPWCSSFVNWSINQVGIKGTNSARALSWSGWGQSLNSPAYGSIAIIDYGGSKGHVGFVAGVNSSGSIILLGGNQSNMVRYSAFSPSSISGYVYPSGYSPSYTLPTLIINKAGGFGSTR
jgi:uncharacterized protein (TIGR02594 family)